jgi:hypothetical protein
MPITAVAVSASPNHLTFLLTGDGTAALILANSTIQAAMVAGPLKNAWDTVLTTQAAMRAKLLGGDSAATGGFCEARLLLLVTPVDTTAQINQPTVDVDTDAVSTTKAEINVGMSATTGQIAYLTLEHRHSAVR